MGAAPLLLILKDKKEPSLLPFGSGYGSFLSIIQALHPRIFVYEILHFLIG